MDDLIYTDTNRIDVDVIKKYNLDHEGSSNQGNNTFQLKYQKYEYDIEVGSFIYCNNTELGGVVSELTIDSSAPQAVAKGITWRGLLEKKILCPSDSADYLVVSGTIKFILNRLVTLTGLASLFLVDGDDGKTITWQFDRYCSLFNGINKMLSRNGYKLCINVVDCIPYLSAEPIKVFDDSDQEVAKLLKYKFTKKGFAINHLIGLGAGELSERQIVHRYVGLNGNISDTQTYFGTDEVADTLDYPNAESMDELIETVEDKLKELYVNDSIDITNHKIEADLGDLFVLQDREMGITASQYVVNKIVTVNNGIASTNYKVGVFE